MPSVNKRSHHETKHILLNSSSQAHCDHVLFYFFASLLNSKGKVSICHFVQEFFLMLFFQKKLWTWSEKLVFQLVKSLPDEEEFNRRFKFDWEVTNQITSLKCNLHLNDYISLGISELLRS